MFLTNQIAVEIIQFVTVKVQTLRCWHKFSLCFAFILFPWKWQKLKLTWEEKDTTVLSACNVCVGVELIQRAHPCMWPPDPWRHIQRRNGATFAWLSFIAGILPGSHFPWMNSVLRYKGALGVSILVLKFWVLWIRMVFPLCFSTPPVFPLMRLFWPILFLNNELEQCYWCV